MVDIETMGNQSYSAIVSIGAVYFDLQTGETGDSFYQTIDLQSSMDAGLKAQADTILWWMNKSEEARKELIDPNRVRLEVGLQRFSSFCSKEVEIWGNSARFDLGLLQNAYNLLSMPIPWNFRKERCVRTLVSFREDIKDNWSHPGTVHNALGDCYNQIGYCAAIYQAIAEKEFA